MPGFDASSVVEPLEYDFTTLISPATGKPYVDASGTIAEPSQAQVQMFLVESQREQQQARMELFGGSDEETATPAEWMAALGKLDPEKTAATRKRNAEILSALCSGHPTPAQLLKLPHRVLVKFAEWLTGEVLNPEASAGGGRLRVVNPRSSAAG